ncbi:MAG: YgjV family protein [Acholeplasmataceae bacterium]|nr:YgjV family protein [Acholeplasmataceae bacterium]
MTQQTLEWIGYAASAIVLISLLMRSVRKLRLINLLGSLLFAFYGFMIGAIPVGLMNAGIVLINLFYLWQMVHEKTYFTLLEASMDTDYYTYFMDFHKQDMETFMPLPTDVDITKAIKYYVLRNTIIAGIIVLKPEDAHTYRVLIDYAIPTYRDFKIGRFVFEGQKHVFLDQGITRLVTYPGNTLHERYLSKMGFSKDDHGQYVLELSR